MAAGAVGISFEELVERLLLSAVYPRRGRALHGVRRRGRASSASKKPAPHLNSRPRRRTVSTDFRKVTDLPIKDPVVIDHEIGLVKAISTR